MQRIVISILFKKIVFQIFFRGSCSPSVHVITCWCCNAKCYHNVWRKECVCERHVHTHRASCHTENLKNNLYSHSGVHVITRSYTGTVMQKRYHTVTEKTTRKRKWCVHKVVGADCMAGGHPSVALSPPPPPLSPEIRPRIPQPWTTASSVWAKDSYQWKQIPSHNVALTPSGSHPIWRKEEDNR